jgi:formylglycine-generating enzyme required for sulfatase activity
MPKAYTGVPIENKHPAEPDLIFVQGGTFLMGCTDEEGKYCVQKQPAHNVTLSSFHIGKYEVTQAQWNALMPKNPSKDKGDILPVENVKRGEAQTFIENLNAATGRHYRLPTEAEWEYAARGGNQSKHYKYAGSNNVNDVAWYGGNNENATHGVGNKRANELGIYDMSGNVGEWCLDVAAKYSPEPQTNPYGPPGNAFSPVIVRGGNVYMVDVISCEVLSRMVVAPTFNGKWVGFRLVLPIEE